MRPQLTDLTNHSSDQENERASLSIAGIDDPNSPTAIEYHNAMMCTRLAGRAIIRVVGRCNDAKENEILDLSSCSLMQVPDAVFHLMRETNLKRCDLSFNVITKLPPIMASKFSNITQLNLSNNRMSKLPDEFSELKELALLNISYNSFISIPKVAYLLPKLEELNAEKNYIAELEEDRLVSSPSLREVNLRENPLRPNVRQKLGRVTSITILLTRKPDDDSWDSDENSNDDESPTNNTTTTTATTTATTATTTGDQGGQIETEIVKKDSSSQ